MQTINNDKDCSFIFEVFRTRKNWVKIFFDLLIVKLQTFTCIWYGYLICIGNRINEKIESFNIDKSIFRIKQYKDSLPFIGSFKQYFNEFER